EQASYCMELGFEMFQGYFFAKPEIISGKRADPAKLSLLKLLALVTGESEVEELEREIKLQPSLSYNLMRMINSVAIGTPKKLTSIKQAIIVLGRVQLKRWIQLLLYTSSQSGASLSNALMQTAAARGKFMELVAQADRPHDKNYHERAFMVGMLSLMDTLLGIEMQKIIDNLGIPEEMGVALLDRQGRLGLELKLAEANDEGNMDEAQEILNELNFLSMDELTNAELEALSWANRVGEMAS
nr:HDOD domain-containing protein [Gammaproteobacteria bacterium]